MTANIDQTERSRIRLTGAISRRGTLKGLGAVGVAAMVASNRLAPVWAQDASPAAGGDLDSYPEIVITARDYSFELPAEIAGGLTRVTLVNEGAEDHHAIFMRLGDEVTQEEVDAAAAEPDFIPLLSLGELLGGPNGPAPGGGTATVIMDLAPGNYQVVCVIPDAEGMPHYMMGMIAPVTVSESTSALSAPETSLTVELVDFGFHDLPEEIPAGPQVWEVVNVGQEPHELVLVKLSPGVTIDMVLEVLGGPPPAGAAGTPAGESMEDHDMAASPAAGAAEAAAGPPFSPVPSTAPKGPGMTNWLVLDLEPGDYAAICFVPSVANGGAPHFALGMIMPFTVV